MELKNVGMRFRAPYFTTTGKKVWGQLLDIPDTSRVSNFLSARRYLRTPVNTPLVFGDVLVVNDTKFIIAQHGDGFYRTPIYRHFKMFQVDEEVAWKTKTTVVNPVTGTVTSPSVSSQGNVFLSVQPARYSDDVSKFSSEGHIAVCNATGIKVDDIIGTFSVRKVDKVLGVTILELRKL